MGCEQYIEIVLGQTNERVIGFDRFPLERIQRCAAQLAASNSLSQGVLVDHAAATTTHDTGAVLHLGEDIGVYQHVGVGEIGQ